MFLDPAIGRDFACKHTKTRFILCETLDPFYKEPKIDHSPYNESNDKSDSVKLLTVFVQDVEHGNGIIRTRHLQTVAITDLSAFGILYSIEVFPGEMIRILAM